MHVRKDNFSNHFKIRIGKVFIRISKKIGYLVPNEGFIGTITLTSQDTDQYVLTKLLMEMNLKI